MSEFDQELDQRLTALSAQGLRRHLRRIDSPQGREVVVEGKFFLNFSSNDYLGLAADPGLREAAAAACRDYGAGSGASRLICGSLAPHHMLDEALAEFKGTAAALSFSSGYAAAAGAICALMGRNDVLIIDKLVHACIIDAARLCAAKLRIFAHNDLADLEGILRWAQARTGAASGQRPRILVVTESVFSMEGNTAPLRAIVALKERYGAWLMVDEAHATGLYGPSGRGLAETWDVGDRIEIQMGTLGKALGSAGGFICGSRALIDYLVNRARSFIFSTAPVPAAAAAALAGVRFVRSAAGAERRALLWQRVAEVRAGLQLSPAPLSSAIIPIPIGAEDEAVKAATAFLEKGILLPAIRFPTVPRGKARLRLTVTAAHTRADVERLEAAARTVWRPAA